jgi:hypothetical protein
MGRNQVRDRSFQNLAKLTVGLASYDVAITIAIFTFLTLRLLTLAKDDDEARITRP